MIGINLVAQEYKYSIEAKIKVFQSRQLDYKEKLVRCYVVDYIHQAVIQDHQSIKPFRSVDIKLSHLRDVNQSYLPLSQKVKSSLAKFLAHHYHVEDEALQALEHVGQVYNIYPLSIEKTIPFLRSVYTHKKMEELRYIARHKELFQQVLQELHATYVPSCSTEKLDLLSDVCAASLTLLSPQQSGQKRKYPFSLSCDDEDVYS